MRLNKIKILNKAYSLFCVVAFIFSHDNLTHFVPILHINTTTVT